MLREFAMMPDLFDTSYLGGDKNLQNIIIELLKKIIEFGQIADLHKGKWSQHVANERIPALPQNIRDKVMTCFKALYDSKRLVRHPEWKDSKPQNDAEWLDSAITSHRIIPFDGILIRDNIVDQALANDPSLIRLEGLFDSALWQGWRNQRTIMKCKSEYRQILAPILRHASRLYLIDPYLAECHQRFMNTIEICYELIGKRVKDPLHSVIHIHTGDPRDENGYPNIPDYLDSWDMAIRALFVSPNFHKFKVFIWRNIPQGRHFHERFIITDRCAIQLTYGLDCYETTMDDNTWTICSYERRNEVLNWYYPRTKVDEVFELIGEQEIY